MPSRRYIQLASLNEQALPRSLARLNSIEECTRTSCFDIQREW
jgi:hypothetical protein